MYALLFLALANVGLAQQEQGCTITASACRNYPEFHRKQFRDILGEEHLKTGNNDAACLKRAEDFHHWCGNGEDSGAVVSATFNPAQWTQVYHPGACQAGWSQWDAFCYKHYWEKKTWFEAEKLCRERNSHLASIHSQAENRFIYTLTSGLSAWIGYTDLDQDTHYTWSDNTQDDFSNFAKNCTGRETEPDCKPEERKQQWYDWEGGDAGTFVCKRNALLPMALIRNVTAKTFVEKPWRDLLPVLAANGLPDITSAMAKPGAAPELKLPDLKADSGAAALSGTRAPPMPTPKFAMPKGSFF